MDDRAKNLKIPPVQTDSTAALREALDQWIEAVNIGSAELIARLYLEDAVLLGTFDPIVLTTPAQRLNYFVNFKERKKLKASIDECHIDMLGGDAGMANGLYTFAFVGNAGAPQTVKARFTLVYARQPKGNWLIKAHHSSIAPKP